MGQKQTTAQFCLGIITKVYRMAYAYERDMNNIKQRRHIHEKWKFGQGGPGVAQMVPRGGKSLGGAGRRGEGCTYSLVTTFRTCILYNRAAMLLHIR